MKEKIKNVLILPLTAFICSLVLYIVKVICHV